ncbi:TetR family transcriptional regulator [Nocardioides sp. J9]|uniref:TetR/AcrR family transcriptional regulator n=1 Tax=Nocardioides sp. J9 TaxID=935844 RepID=UPI0011ACC152|nr:TetR/AcrR family transcriptional regulator [Nocardioides sp. J9]TWG98588.1 TetR family transcriptional regulator [Nocardioides sp. J9]
MSDSRNDLSAKDRLLLAATNLMDRGEDFSTRDVLAAAQVTAPTLYHHFGNKQGLTDAVARHGFSQYVVIAPTSADAVGAIRDGWRQHVEFGLEHPRFYARLYGNIEPGRPCAVTAPALDMLLRVLEPAAIDGRLLVAPRQAAPRILAANVGVTLSLIGQPEDARDPDLSAALCEAVLASVFEDLVSAHRPTVGVASHAIALAAGLPRANVSLSDAERALLLELLERIANAEDAR